MPRFGDAQDAPPRASERIDGGTREEVRLARATLGMSRRQVARLAGISSSTLASVEAGKASVQVDTVASVCAAVGLRLWARAYPAKAPSLRDTGQLELVMAVTGQAHTAWRSAMEHVVDAKSGRAADLILFGPEGDTAPGVRARAGRLAGPTSIGPGQAGAVGGDASATGAIRPGRRGYASQPSDSRTAYGQHSSRAASRVPRDLAVRSNWRAARTRRAALASTTAQRRVSVVMLRRAALRSADLRWKASSRVA